MYNELLKKICNELNIISYDDLMKRIEETSVTQVIDDLIYSKDNLKENYELAGSIIMWEIYKNAPLTIKDYVSRLKKKMNNSTACYLLLYSEELEKNIIHYNDFKTNFFIASSWKNTFLHKKNREDTFPSEIPQFVYLRISVALNINKKEPKIEDILTTYFLLSNRQIGLATPSLLNLGMEEGAPTSCIISTVPDSLEGILVHLKRISYLASKNCGLGVSFSNLRRSAVRDSDDSVPLTSFAKAYEASLLCINRGGRKATLCISLKDYHHDLREMINMVDKRNKEHFSLIVLSIQVSDLFMSRVKEKKKWTLFCPKLTEMLSKVYGEEFKKLYEKYEEESVSDPKKYNSVTLDAESLFKQICEIQINNGNPYICYIDRVNERNPQKHYAVIDGPNLCQEILLPSPQEDFSACNLATINLSLLARSDGTVDYEMLGEMTRKCVRILNQIIDCSSNKLIPNVNKTNSFARPIGIGVCGFADLLYRLKIPIQNSDETLNEEVIRITENIWACKYYYALLETNQMAKENGYCPCFINSPISKGQFQFNLAGLSDSEVTEPSTFMNCQGTWETLRKEIMNHGVYNMNLLSIQPTATSAQLLGVFENVELPTSHTMMRVLKSGEYFIPNLYLYEELKKRGLWNNLIYSKLKINRGSVQNLDIDEDLKRLFITMYEMRQMNHVALAKIRQKYIDHSQSMSLFFENISPEKLKKIHLYIHEQGLKTGIYYLHSRSANDAIRFDSINTVSSEKAYIPQCKLDDPSCQGCSA